jgi:hypothetical protein
LTVYTSSFADCHTTWQLRSHCEPDAAPAVGASGVLTAGAALAALVAVGEGPSGGTGGCNAVRASHDSLMPPLHALRNSVLARLLS